MSDPEPLDPEEAEEMFSEMDEDDNVFSSIAYILSIAVFLILTPFLWPFYFLIFFLAISFFLLLLSLYILYFVLAFLAGIVKGIWSHLTKTEQQRKFEKQKNDSSLCTLCGKKLSLEEKLDITTAVDHHFNRIPFPRDLEGEVCSDCKDELLKRIFIDMHPEADSLPEEETSETD